MANKKQARKKICEETCLFYQIYFFTLLLWAPMNTSEFIYHGNRHVLPLTICCLINCPPCNGCCRAPVGLFHQILHIMLIICNQYSINLWSIIPIQLSLKRLEIHLVFPLSSYNILWYCYKLVVSLVIKQFSDMVRKMSVVPLAVQFFCYG